MDNLEEVKEHYKYVEERQFDLSLTPFATVLIGSQNYNLATPSTGVKTRTIMVPKFKALLHRNVPCFGAFSREGGPRCDIVNIKDVVKSWEAQYIDFVEMLFTKFVYVPEAYRDLWEEITSSECAEKIAHYNTYAVVKNAQYNVAATHKALLSNSKDIDKYGYSRENLHDLCRLYFFLLSYLSGKKTYPQCLASKEEHKFLLSLKTNPVPLAEATAMAERYHKNCDTLAEQYYQWHQPEPNREVEQYLADWMERVFCRVNNIKESDVKC